MSTPTNAYEIMDYASCQTGWGRQSQLEVCLDFINQKDKVEPDFDRYVQKLVNNYLDESGYFTEGEQ